MTVALVLAGAALVASSSGGCDGCEGRGGDARRLIPAAPRAAFVIDHLEHTRAALANFLAGIEGASGFLELAEARLGVNLTSTEGLRRAGLDPAGSAAVFTTDEGLALAVAVADPDLFRERVRRQALVAGAGEIAPPRGDPPLSEAEVPPGVSGHSPAWELVWGVTGDRVGLVVLATRREGAARSAGPPLPEVWARLAQGDGAFMRSAAAAARRRDEGAVGLWFTGAPETLPLSLPEALHGALGGLLGGALGGGAVKLASWGGRVELDDTRAGLRLEATLAPDSARLPAPWLPPPGPGAAFAAMLPRTTTLLGRARVNLAPLRAIPRFVRDRMLPDALPPGLGLPTPPLGDLLDLASGDVAVAVLGLDPQATVNQLLGKLRGARGRLAEALQLVHVAVALGVRDHEAAQQLMDALADAARRDGWTVAALRPAGSGAAALRGYTLRRKGEVHTLLLQADILAWVTGRGEVERFLAVAHGTALSYASLAADEQGGASRPGSPGEGSGAAPAPTGTQAPAPGDAAGASEGGSELSAALSGPGVLLGLAASFTRLTRELAAKGAPPYFLKMLNDLYAVAATARVDAEHASFALDIVL